MESNFSDSNRAEASALLRLATVQSHFGNHDKAHALLSLANWIFPEDERIIRALLIENLEIKNLNAAENYIFKLESFSRNPGPGRDVYLSLAARFLTTMRRYDEARDAIAKLKGKKGVGR